MATIDPFAPSFMSGPTASGIDVRTFIATQIMAGYLTADLFTNYPDQMVEAAIRSVNAAKVLIAALNADKP